MEISFTKRNLTDDEIEYVISEIKNIKIFPNKYVRDNILKYHLGYIVPELKQYKMYVNVPYYKYLEKLKEEITKQFISSLVQPGEMVGELAAQSIGQPITQCTLSGFHTTGIENVTTTTGIPKINEILNASDNPKNINCVIYLKQNNKFKSLSDVRKWTKQFLKEITIGYLLDDYTIINCDDDEYDTSFYKQFQQLYKSSQYNLINTNRSFLRLKFNRNKLWLHQIYFYNIANIIELKYSDSCCVWSPEFDGIFDIYVDLSEIEKTEHNKFFEKIVFSEIKKLTLTKCSNISDAFVRLGADEYIIDTNGSNLDYIFSLEDVNELKTVTNNIREIYKIFGIQATYEFIIQTIENILAAEGTGVSKRHLSILACVMTHTGILSSINRYGIQCQLSSTLSNSSFEQTLDNFIKASIIGTKDNTSDVSASIICGSLAKIGTNMCDVLMDLSQYN